MWQRNYFFKIKKEVPVCVWGLQDGGQQPGFGEFFLDFGLFLHLCTMDRVQLCRKLFSEGHHLHIDGLPGTGKTFLATNMVKWLR